MIKALKKKYALSNQGAKDLLKGIVYSVLARACLKKGGDCAKATK